MFHIMFGIVFIVMSVASLVGLVLHGHEYAGTLWEYDRNVYRIDSGVGLGAFSGESTVHPEESLISFLCLLRYVMTQVIIKKKWGNSLSVRLPSAIVKAASLNVDDVVELSVEDGAITIVPVKTKEYSLDALMAGVTNENIHEISFGAPVGKELL
ncbi:AbrB/MazE/SpoVT family DNA-binding domain-containing protein [Escherichia coli]|uniref:AbrB/MazE/SpoVT family DNA-binding domain-containing protein n=1 Tax=Escherichia coli TaxID=562 RepID=UPI0039C8911D